MTPKCGAKTRAGGRCQQHALPNGRCRFHGGKSLGGIASPTFKTGRYSKYLPTRLLERYQASADDPELLALRHDIALVDARLADVLARVDTVESGALWKRLQATHAALVLAQAKDNAQELTTGLSELGLLIGRGLGDWATWEEIGRLVEQRRRLVESETKRLVAGHQVLRLDEANLLILALAQAVRNHVADHGTLNAINAEFARLLGRQAPAGADAGPGGDA